MELAKFLEDNEDWRPYADLVAIPPTPSEITQECPNASKEILDRSMEFTWENGGFVSRGAIYLRVRREADSKGESADRWATMLALQAPPGCKTTDTFWGGRKHFSEVYGEEYASTIKRKLAAKGVNLKANDEYMPELARYQGDPEAVIPFDNARGYIQRLCQKRGWAVEGAVNVEHRPPEYDASAQENCIPMADGLIKQKFAKMCKKNPDLRKLPVAERRAAVLEKYGPSK
jgi:hypothetical protein